MSANLDNRIYNTAVSMGIPDAVARNIVKQARLETADYTSNVFKQNNNLYGYKYVGQTKWALGPGLKSSEYGTDQSVYARYSSPENSVGELVDWLARRQAEGKFRIADLTTEQAYAQALKSAGFYGITAASYAASLLAKARLVDWSKIGKIGGTAVLFVAIGIIAFIAYRQAHT